MSLAIWYELSRDKDSSQKNKFTAWAIGSSIAVAGWTGKMIIENMFHRSVGKYMSKLTIPAFIISTAVTGGYLASEAIDPDKGTDRFTDSLLDPVGTARITATLGVYALQDNLVTPDIGTGQNMVSHDDVYEQIPLWNRYLNLI